MNAFIRKATGAFEVSSVVSQTGQTSSDSSLGRGWFLLARRRRACERQREQDDGEAPHAGASACWIPLSTSLASSTGPAMR